MNFGARFILGLVIFCLLSFAGVNFARASSCEVVPGPIRYEAGTLGKHLYVPCAGGTHIGLSCTHAVCDPAKFGGVIAGIYTAADREAAYAAAVRTYLPWNCDAPPDAAAVALCKERADFLRPPVWRVKANGTATTRPAYALTNGVLGTVIVARAPVGAVCDLTKPTAPASLGDIRAEYGTAQVVTICTRGN